MALSSRGSAARSDTHAAGMSPLRGWRNPYDVLFRGLTSPGYTISPLARLELLWHVDGGTRFGPD